MSFHKNFFAYILIILFAFLTGAAYARFVIHRDYMVSYEGVCDPLTYDCYIGCEDDACSEPYYYMWVEKHAADLYAQCGKDITECDAANTCLSGAEDQACTIEYCDSTSVDAGCETMVAKPSPPSFDDLILIEAEHQNATTSPSL